MWVACLPFLSGQAPRVFHAAGQEQMRVRRTTMSGLLSLLLQIAALGPVLGSGTVRAVRAYLTRAAVLRAGVI